MINIPIKDEIVSHCRNLLKKTNFGNRGVADGNASEQLRGIVGQSVVLDFLGLPFIESNGFDNGVDFTYKDKTYDVKTMGRNCEPKPYFVNNLIGLQDKYKVDRYIFCSLNRTNMILTICGWIDKNDFIEKASFYNKGTVRTRSDNTSFQTKADLYELPNKELNDFSLIV